MSTINVRVTNEEKDMAQKLADYLFKVGKIQSPTLSDAMRQSLHFTVNQLLKAVETERYGR